LHVDSEFPFRILPVMRKTPDREQADAESATLAVASIRNGPGNRMNDADLQASFRALHDETALYLRIDVRDSELSLASGPDLRPGENDHVRIDLARPTDDRARAGRPEERFCRVP